MTEWLTDGQTQQAGTRLKRRGILAAAGAIVAGIVAKQASVPVAAATAGTGSAVSLVLQSNSLGSFDTLPGQAQAPNVASAATDLDASANFGNYVAYGAYVFRADARPAVSGNISGLEGYGRGSGIGVLGDGNGGTGAVGVQGQNAQYGVVGKVSNVNDTIAVWGNNTSSGSGGIGVQGRSDPTTGIGVEGISNLGIGVFGASNGNAGVFGTTTKSGFSGLAGIVSTAGTAAFAGTATVPTAFAGFFTGDVFVNGNFTVNDPTRKHGAILHPDGSHRLLYSMESPESWVEDFGIGQLANGKAEVHLDPDFAAVVHAEDYLIFLTPKGDSRGLTVAAQDATGFTVAEISGGTGAGTFYWRVVARPKTTNKAERLAKFTIPDIKVPLPPPTAPVSVATVPDASPQAVPPSRPTASAATGVGPQGAGTPPGGTTSPVQPAPPPRP